MSTSKDPVRAKWAQLLIDAVVKPGVISEAYRRFWNYSSGNQLLALFQCSARDLPAGPLNTFLGWKGLGRRVKKGERAITLCMPIQLRRNRQLKNEENDSETPQRSAKTLFVYHARWFVISQTEGTEYVPQEMPEWSEAKALQQTGIDRVRFTHLNGNALGYASARTVAVSPIAPLPHKTLFHEMAHVLLGHTRETLSLEDHDYTPRTVREVEAECVALLCCESLSLPGANECRGYIQHWLGSESITERSAQRIFHASDLILRSGRADLPPEGDEHVT